MSTSTAHSIASQILTLALTGEWPQGTHLSAQALADQLNVSRQPVNEALKLLESEGVVRRERYRGCFLEGDARTWAAAAERLSPADDANADDVTQAYFRIADDLLRGELPSSVSESLLKSRYDLSKAQLTALLQRIAGEGWIERRQGYGWRFATMLTTPDSLLQSYRLRLALEPAALMEPGYRISPDSIARCRAAELRLLNGGMDTDSADAMHERGVNFHESLVQASGNPFFIDAIGRVNRVRRLLSYRSMQDRTRYREHCQQHLHILELLEQGRNTEASDALRTHLQSTLHNLERISGLLQAAPPPPKEPS